MSGKSSGRLMLQVCYLRSAHHQMSNCYRICKSQCSLTISNMDLQTFPLDPSEKRQEVWSPRPLGHWPYALIVVIHPPPLKLFQLVDTAGGGMLECSRRNVWRCFGYLRLFVNWETKSKRLTILHDLIIPNSKPANNFDEYIIMIVDYN